jgi:UDP-3-O-[3-hydroxymyristoyl] N-acetylglucosamine deacetylase/3-hydroxyacyl-[acyl-carrier-protein] dehydratase
MSGGRPDSATPRQRTLDGTFTLEGIGLHSGLPVRTTLGPAEPDTGIVFRRIDLDGAPVVPADVEMVSGVAWETALSADGGLVRTVEHLLAAVAVHGIDNLDVELDGAEPPALDGSAAGWCEAIRRVGTVEQDAAARTVVVQEAFSLAEGDARYTVGPHPAFRVSAEIDFENPAIGRQFASAEVECGSFCREVAPARTFGLENWRDALHAKGLALGATYENTLVITDDGLAPGTELRYPDEFVRHKILDIIGDLALVGARIQAHIVAERPSHRGNVTLARRLRRLLARPVDGGSVLDIDGILEYIPHRFPFLLVDRVLEFEPGKRIVGLKNVTVNEPFFEGHFPGHPIMPGVLIVEAMAQAGGLLLMNEVENPQSSVMYFLGLDDVKFRHTVVPGDQLVSEVRLLQFRGRTCRMSGVATVNGKVVAEAKMLARIVDR